MTDAVYKNLLVPEGVAKKLGSQHIPLQLLCCAHSCETFDRKSLEVLYDAEEKLNLKEQFLKQIPSLNASFRAQKSLAEVVIEATTN